MATIIPRGKYHRAEVYVLGVRKNATFDTKAEAKAWAARVNKMRNETI